MKSVTRRRYTPGFKAQAVSLVGMGKPVPEVAEDLEIGTSILYGCDAKLPTSNSRMTF